MIERYLRLLALLLAGATTVWAGPIDKDPQPVGSQASLYDPVEHWEFDFEEAGLWRVGSNGTPLNYTFVPTLLTFKTPAHFNFATSGGGSIVLRSRFTALLEPIVAGPETHFFGATASGSLEWWNANRTWSTFFSSGGGIGWLDSRGKVIEGAQGRNFNFTWFLYSGIRYHFQEHLSAALGIYYQHVSNGGTYKINPGVDALGPILSIGWHF